MNQRSSSFYKKIILLILIIIIVLISVFAYYLYNIEKNHAMSFDETSEMVIKETDITQILQKSSFQEKELYHIFVGENDSEEELLASVHLPEDSKEISKKDIKTYESTDLIPEDAMLDQWEQTCNQCEFINIQPALIDKDLLWEIKYNEADNRYVFEYYLMSDGSEYESFKLKRNFN